MEIKNYELKKWPMPPRKICRTIVDRWFGIVSPSLLFRYGGDKEVKKYCYQVNQYKLYKRKLTKAEYKQLVRDINLNNTY